MPDLFDIDDGALGIEALWTWDGLVLNDPDQDAHLHISKITGLHSAADHEDPRAPRIARIGETPYPTSALGKTVVLEGTVRGVSLPAIRAFGRQLRAAFADLRSEKSMDIAPRVELGGPAARFHARALQLDGDDVQRTIRWSRPLTLGLRLSDPRVYWPSLAVDETGNDVAVDNPGSAPVEPVLTVLGAGGVVTVSRDGGEILTFRGVSGDLVVDFAARTSIAGALNRELLAADSTWWDRGVDGIPPGASVISQTGGTSVRVQFTPGSW